MCHVIHSFIIDSRNEQPQTAWMCGVGRRLFSALVRSPNREDSHLSICLFVGQSVVSAWRPSFLPHNGSGSYSKSSICEQNILVHASKWAIPTAAATSRPSTTIVVIVGVSICDAGKGKRMGWKEKRRSSATLTTTWRLGWQQKDRHRTHRTGLRLELSELK